MWFERRSTPRCPRPGDPCAHFMTAPPRARTCRLADPVRRWLPENPSTANGGSNVCTYGVSSIAGPVRIATCLQIEGYASPSTHSGRALGPAGTRIKARPSILSIPHSTFFLSTLSCSRFSLLRALHYFTFLKLLRLSCLLTPSSSPSLLPPSLLPKLKSAVRRSRPSSLLPTRFSALTVWAPMVYVYHVQHLLIASLTKRPSEHL